MPLFEAIHPDCELLFCFDNSQNHHARKPNALWVHNMNLNDGGKQPILRPTTWNGVPQSLQYDDGKQKGIRTILTERQLWVPGLKLMCQPCRQHDPPDDNLTCCARRVLSDCPDFQEDCCWLEETLKARNHKLMFFPKFHCELNFIEMIWGYAKARLRAGCEFNFKWLEAQLPTVLDSIPLSFFRSTSRHCFRYMDSYRYDLTPAARLYAMKKFRGHRMIPRESLALVVKEFDDIQSKKIRAHVTL